jgi:hypothetical protein
MKGCNCGRGQGFGEKGLPSRWAFRKTRILHADPERADSHEADWYRAIPMNVKSDAVDLRSATEIDNPSLTAVPQGQPLSR